MSNSSGVEFIDENASEDVTPRLYQVKRLPIEKVPKIISLITKVGIPLKYAEYVAFGLATIILAVALYGVYGNLVPNKYTMTRQQKAYMQKIMQLPVRGSSNE